MPKLTPVDKNKRDSKFAPSGGGSQFPLYNVAKPKCRTHSFESLFPKAYLSDPNRFCQQMMPRTQKPVPLFKSHLSHQTNFVEKVRNWDTSSGPSPPINPTWTKPSSSSESQERHEFEEFDPEALELIEIIKRWE